MWTPGDGFDSSRVIRVDLNGIDTRLIPHQQTIVIASTGQELTVRRPFQATHLLPVSSQLSLRIVRSRVVLKNESISRTRIDTMIIPGQSTDTSRVTRERRRLSVTRRIPDLNMTCRERERELE